MNRAVPFSVRSGLVLAVASVGGLMMLMWPLLVRESSGGQVGPPFVFLALLPVVIVVVLAELSEGGLDPRVLAVLGVLSAINAVLRGLSPGTGGVELVFFVLILAGRVFGPGFEFVLGCTSLFASVLLTGGVGPWLPFQMVGAAWVGLGAGLLPRATGRRELGLLAAYAFVASIAYGFLLNLWFWPFMTADQGFPPGLSYVPGGAFVENLQHWMLFNLATSLGFDLPRAVLAVTLVLVAGRPVLTALRRASRRAAFEVPVRFEGAR